MQGKPESKLIELTRRRLFVGFAGCLTCARAGACGPQVTEQVEHTWTEKADMTWEQIFKFAYQKDLIPLLKELSDPFGREKFVQMIKDASDAVVLKKTAGRPPAVPDLVSLAGNMKNMPPLMQHARDVEIVEQTAEALEYRVKKCLWAKAFRDEAAGDIGYAMVCYPDYAVARGLNPKLQLLRTKTLMQGDDSCSLRYVLEG
jgi:hypothetical protein